MRGNNWLLVVIGILLLSSCGSKPPERMATTTIKEPQKISVRPIQSTLNGVSEQASVGAVSIANSEALANRVSRLAKQQSDIALRLSDSDSSNPLYSENLIKSNELISETNQLRTELSKVAVLNSEVRKGLVVAKEEISYLREGIAIYEQAMGSYKETNAAIKKENAEIAKRLSVVDKKLAKEQVWSSWSKSAAVFIGMSLILFIVYKILSQKVRLGGLISV